jgi:hypothetical protein
MDGFGSVLVGDSARTVSVAVGANLGGRDLRVAGRLQLMHAGPSLESAQL